MNETDSHALPETARSPAAFQTVTNRLLGLAMTQRCCNTFLHEALEEALRTTDGLRAFIARIEPETGELLVIETAGAGWTEENKRIRLQPHNVTQRGITGYVAITGAPYVSPDVSHDPHYIPAFSDVKSEVAVPFFDADERVRGILNVESERVAGFNALHVAQLTTLANIIGIALAFEAYRERERMLIEIGMDLAATTEIEPLVVRVVEVAARVLHCEGASVFLLDEATQTLILRATRGNLRPHVNQAFYHLGEGLTGAVAQTGETLRLDDPRDDPRWLGRYTELTPEEWGAFLAVPVTGRERILGVLRVARPRQVPAWFQPRFTEDDERVLRTIAAQLGTAIENIGVFNKLVRTERMAAWGELSAKSAHMIGNRTFAIKGDLNELKFLLSQPESNAAATRNVQQEIVALTESIERGVFRLEDILREFRDFVMATHLTLRPLDLNQLTRDTVAETFPKRTPVVLEEDYAPDLPDVACDGEKLKRAFGELVENAVSFMPEGGTLRVETRWFAPGTAPAGLRLSPTRGYVRVTFADTGPGVPDDLKEKIFTPFFTSRVKGMGLGLSIVKGIVDAHHGLLHEGGEAGRGARFEIFLPVGTKEQR